MTYYDELAKGYDSLHKEEQKKKLAIISKYIDPKPDEKLLDVGCGTGLCSDWNCTCTGIDPSLGLIKEAEKKNDKVRFVQGSAEDMPFKDNYFDYVISVSAVHLFKDMQKGLEEIKRVGKDRFVLTVLKKSSMSKDIIEKIRSIFDVKEEIEEEKDIIIVA